MKNSKMDYEYATGQIKNLPESWQAPLTHALSDCKDAGKLSYLYLNKNKWRNDTGGRMPISNLDMTDTIL